MEDTTVKISKDMAEKVEDEEFKVLAYSRESDGLVTVTGFYRIFFTEFNKRITSLGERFNTPGLSHKERHATLLEYFTQHGDWPKHMVKFYCPYRNQWHYRFMYMDNVRHTLSSILHNDRHGFSVKEAAGFYKACGEEFPYCSAMIADREDCCSRKPKDNEMGMCTQHFNIYRRALSRRMAMFVALCKIMDHNLAEELMIIYTNTYRVFNTVWSEEREHKKN